MPPTNDHLYILWTSGDPVTAEKMVFMYAVNSRLHNWWEKVTLIIWGASAQLAAADAGIQALIREALDAGVHVSACKRCALDLGVAAQLEALGVEVIYWGQPLTEVLRSGQTLLSV